MAKTPEDVAHGATVPGTPSQAFRVFAEHLPTWWPENFRTTKTGAPLFVDTGEGGRIYETDEGNAEHTFATILAYDPPKRLAVAWHLDGYGRIDPDPEHASEFEVRFASAGAKKTRVDVVHTNFVRMGAHANRVRNGMDRGWPTILERYTHAMKTHETKEDQA